MAMGCQHGRLPDDAGTGAEPAGVRRHATPTGEPCPRSVRVDGSVDGSGDCHGCGACLLGTGLV